jgi:hypothetical protein
MRLSLMKAAHVAPFGTAYRKYGYLPGFGRCGIPRLSTGRSLLATGLDVHGHLHPVHSGAEVCGIPHLPKPGRYGAPVIRFGLRFTGYWMVRAIVCCAPTRRSNRSIRFLADKVLTYGNHLVTVTVWLRIGEGNTMLSSGQSRIQHGEKSSAFSVADIRPLAGSPATFE